jgi:hypothetical protein
MTSAEASIQVIPKVVLSLISLVVAISAEFMMEISTDNDNRIVLRNTSPLKVTTAI